MLYLRLATRHASNRVAYFGSSNVELGKNAGELMKAAMAGKGGKCIGFVGLPGAATPRNVSRATTKPWPAPASS